MAKDTENKSLVKKLFGFFIEEVDDNKKEPEVSIDDIVVAEEIKKEAKEELPVKKEKVEEKPVVQTTIVKNPEAEKQKKIVEEKKKVADEKKQAAEELKRTRANTVINPVTSAFLNTSATPVVNNTNQETKTSSGIVTPTAKKAEPERTYRATTVISPIFGAQNDGEINYSQETKEPVTNLDNTGSYQSVLGLVFSPINGREEKKIVEEDIVNETIASLKTVDFLETPTKLDRTADLSNTFANGILIPVQKTAEQPKKEDFSQTYENLSLFDVDDNDK